MQLDQFVARASDAITVRRVFAEPYEKNGTTVIAAARVQGGGGGGGGHDGDSQEGEGGGVDMTPPPGGGGGRGSAGRPAPPAPTWSATARSPGSRPWTRRGSWPRWLQCSSSGWSPRARTPPRAHP